MRRGRERCRRLLASIAVAGAAACAGEREPPNVIVVVVDTLRADYVHGGHGVRTPALDGLAADGVAFELAFAHAPMTLPAHTALFSSRYPHVSGTEVNGHPVDAALPLFAEWLRAAGYHTAGVVSIGTLKPRRDGDGLARGFAHYDDRTQDLPRAHDAHARLLPVVRELPRRAPFFLFAHYSDPHTPYNAHGTASCEVELRLDDVALERLDVADMQSLERELSVAPGEHRLEVVARTPATDDPERAWRAFGAPRIELRQAGEPLPFRVEGSAKRSEHLALVFENATASEQRIVVDLWIHDAPRKEEREPRYRLEVEYVDRSIGELVAELKRLDLYDDSLIVFTSDHGEGLGDHGHPGHVRYLYDEAIRVPLIVKLPRDHPATPRLHAARTRIARHVDVVPTILELLGLEPLPGQMGRSLFDEREHVHFAETRENEAPQDLVALRDERYKLIYRVRDDAFEMYDLERDPGELQDVFDELGDARASWQSQLRQMGARHRVLELGELDPETQAMLEALGYVGDGE